MKKILSLLLVAVLAFAMVSCAAPTAYDRFMAAEVGSTVTVEAYVQGHQSWWDNKLTVYAQDRDGGYMFYEMECTEAQAEQLVPGTKIKVTGKKTVYGGLVEIYDPCTLVEIIADDTWVATAVDVTSKVGTAELENYMNRKVSFKGMTVVAYDSTGAAFKYKTGSNNDDVYVKLSNGTTTVEFCVERYLTAPDSAVYQAVEALKVGDVIDVDAFLYWYDDAPNPHIIGVTAAD